MLDKVLIVARTEKHEILSRFVITTLIVVIAALMDDVHFKINLWTKKELIQKSKKYKVDNNQGPGDSSVRENDAAEEAP